MAQGLEPRRMARVELHRISARDGRDLPVWLTLPVSGPEGRAAPAVVLVHDEPWWRGGHWDWEPMAQFLASRGYLVVAPEFRGSTGYGQKHFEAGWKQWGLAMQDDVADALLWAQKQGLASDRACIAGAGYGGYSALIGLARHPQLYRCGVVWNGLIDPTAIVEGVSYVYGHRTTSSGQRRYLMEKLIGDADAQSLKALSALNQTARIRAPLLLAHGSRNPVVPIDQAELLRDKLTKQGAAPEWVAYPRDGHQWLELGSRLDWARRVEIFLQRHLAETPDEIRIERLR
jgi:dipeptidyl aminopeptidase/acylaminoacyl peptidase